VHPADAVTFSEAKRGKKEEAAVNKKEKDKINVLGVRDSGEVWGGG
jgi:hypothetical protein